MSKEEKIDTDLEWKTVKVDIKDLIPYPNNPRTMTKKEYEGLKDSMQNFNEVELPAINLDNMIIAGHQRIEVMKRLGRKEIEVRVPNRKLSMEEVTEYNLRSNRNTGSWNWDELANFDEEVLRKTGFREDEIALIAGEMRELPESFKFEGEENSLFGFKIEIDEERYLELVEVLGENFDKKAKKINADFFYNLLMVRK